MASEALKQINALNKEIAKIDKEKKKLGKEALKDLSKELFDLGTVKMIYWEQYTPFHNDGEECIFEISDIYFCNREVDQHPEQYTYEFEDDDPELEDFHMLPAWGEDKPAAENFFGAKTLKAMAKFKEFIKDNEDLMEDMLGDHIRVFVTEKKVEIEEYVDHY